MFFMRRLQYAKAAPTALRVNKGSDNPDGCVISFRTPLWRSNSNLSGGGTPSCPKMNWIFGNERGPLQSRGQMLLTSFVQHAIASSTATQPRSTAVRRWRCRSEEHTSELQS